MTPPIEEQLQALEREQGARVVYACESGSRAWGFASTDSDYDVRFLYVRPLDHYLSFRVEQKRDVLELPIHGDLDMNGWDLRKAMQLLVKSNGALVEWLTSPIVYRAGLDALRQALPEFVCPRSLGFHYLQMARGALKDVRGEVVNLKRCFYTLRPALAARWLERRDSLPPVAFEALRQVLPHELSPLVDDLLKRKQSGSEKDRESVNPALIDFLGEEVHRLEAVVPLLRVEKPDLERMDALFREQIKASG